LFFSAAFLPAYYSILLAYLFVDIPTSFIFGVGIGNLLSKIFIIFALITPQTLTHKEIEQNSHT